MKIKTRVRMQCFANGKDKVGSVTVTSAFIVEVYVNRRWTAVGTEGSDGIAQFQTREEAEKLAKELHGQDVAVGGMF